MAEGDGGSSGRFEEIEDAIRTLLEHAALSDKRIDGLATAIAATNEKVIRLGGAMESLGDTVKDLLGGLRELIDSIPPQNLR